MNKLTDKKSIIFLNIFVFALLATLNIMGYLYLGKYEVTLKNNFKEQIRNLSVYWETIFHADELEFLEPGMEYESISIYYQSLLADMKERLQIKDIKILNPSREILVDHTIDYRIGVSVDFGQINWSRILNSSGPFFVESSSHGVPVYNIFLPLKNSNREVVAVLYLKMTPDLLVSLNSFKSALFWLNLIMIGVVIFLGIISSFLLYKYLSLSEEQFRRERLAQLGEMSAIIAHEIRNPLGIIQGSTNILKKKIEDASLKEVVLFIEDEIKRLNQMINQLLQYVRQPQLKIETIELSQLLEELLSQFGNQHENIHIVKNVESDLKVRSDKNALKQIFLNILQNAVNALEENPNDPRIEVNSHRDGKNIRLELINNGPVIPDDVLEKIFQPFFTTRQKGSGLGLPISKMLLEHMNGQIEIRNLSDSSGVKVIIILPAAG